VAHVPRLYHPGPLGPGPLTLGGEASKRLTTVMRLAPGDPFLVFAGDGHEWHARLTSTARGNSIATVEGLSLTGDERVGAMIVRRALEAPLRQIATNAGLDGAVVVQNVRSNKTKNWGYNAASESYEDLVKSGVIDPTKVVRTALQNAASVASLLLTTDALVSDIPEKEKEGAGAGHGHAH